MEWVSQAGQVSPACSVVPKFVRGSPGALHSATSMDSIALIAGNLLQEKSASSCLVPLRVGMISKRTRDRSLGRRVGTLLGEGHESILMVRFRDRRLDGPLWPQVLLWLGPDKVTAPLAPSHCHPESPDPSSPGTPQQVEVGVP